MAAALVKGKLMWTRTCISALALLLLAALPLPAMAVVRGTLAVGSLPEVVVDFEADTPPESLEYQQSFTTGEPPVVTYGLFAEASMDGDYGFLSAYASAELTGIPPTVPGYYGVSAEADLYSVDRLNVESSVLEDGTEVELAFRMDVQGNGRADARMYVDRQEGTNLFNVLNLSYSASGGGSVSDFSEGSIVAKVGQRYRIEYSLLVTVDLSPNGLSETNPTKFLVSDYPNVRYYVEPVSQPAVALVATSFHDYTPVPEPDAAAAALAATSALVRHRLRDMQWRRERRRCPEIRS
jgi:hypothetical protein